MSERDLLALVRRYATKDERQQGITLLRDFIVKADEYYQGKPRPDDRADPKAKRSRVVSRDVAEAVDSQMPDYMRIFGGSEEVITYEPSEPSDEDFAEQATQTAQQIFWVENTGFENIYNHIKAGLLYRYGVLKVWWEDTRSVQFEDYTGLNEEERRAIELNPDTEIIEETSYPDPDETQIKLAQLRTLAENAALKGLPFEFEFDSSEVPSRFDLRVKRVSNNGRIRIQVVPNEEFFWDGYAQNWEDALWQAQARETTRSELLEMGYSEEDIEEVTFGSADDRSDWIKSSRFDSTTQETDDPSSIDESLQTTEYWEFYLKTDWDGDGIAELRRVCVAGDGLTKILSNEPVADTPFVVWTPIIDPFRTIGGCPAEQAMDIQDIKTVVIRNMLDNFYRLNNSRIVYGPGADRNDVLNPAPGAPIKAQNPAQDVVVLSSPNLTANALEVVNYIDQIKERRIGVSLAAQGLEAEALSDTARVAQLQLQAGQQRKELIARVYAETALKPVFRKLLGLMTRHINQQRIIRLRGKYVTVDPSNWRDNYDVSVNLGISQTERNERLAKLQGLAPYLTQLMEYQGSPNGPLIGLPEIYNFAKEVIRATGLKNFNSFIRNPGPDAQIETPQPQPDPALAQMQALAQIEAQKAQLKYQTDMARLELQKQTEVAKLQSELVRLKAELAKAEQSRLDQQDEKIIDTTLKAEELRLKYQQPSLQIGGPDVGLPPLEDVI